jgi:hypothetical protein
MYPVTCKDGSDHAFAFEENDHIVCSKCGTTEEAYRSAFVDCEKVMKATRAFADILNNIDAQFVGEAMYETMLRTHRTLQQDFVRAIGAFIKHMSKMETDGRNADAVEWCNQVSKIGCHLPRV